MIMVRFMAFLLIRKLAIALMTQALGEQSRQRGGNFAGA
jgi:hypothetical protein